MAPNAEPAASRADRGWALGVFLVALLLRAAHLLTIRDSPFFTVLYIDPLWYDEWAQRIAAGQLVGDRPFFLDPLYAYFLGAIFAVFGHDYFAVGAVQGLAGAAMAPLVLLAARRWFPPATARLAGIIAAVYLPGIYFGGILMKPAISMVLATVTLFLLSRALGGPEPWPWLASGVALGATCLARGNTMLVVPFLLAWIVARTDAGWRRRCMQAALCAAGTAVVLAVPTIHNYVVSGELILSSANAGANFFIGNNPTNRSGEYQQLPFVNANPKHEQHDFDREAERRAGRALSDRETSAFWFEESQRWIREHPQDWLALMLRKVRSFWGAYETPDSLDYYLYRETAPVLRLPLPGFGLLAPLALVGAVLAVRRRGWPQLLVLFVFAYMTSIVIFFVFSRFRMPIVSALYVLAAHGSVELVRRWRAAGTGLGAAVWPTAVLVALFAFVNLPVRARTDTWSYRIASALHVPTRPETSALGHFNLAAAYAARGRDEEREAGGADAESARWLALAEAEFRKALALQTDRSHARMQVELGKVLARQQRNREAIELYRQAAEIEPGDYRIHHSLGLLFRREGDLPQAIAAFERALQLQPRHTASATQLGESLLGAGRYAEAERAFRHALALAPEDRAALDGLSALNPQR